MTQSIPQHPDNQREGITHDLQPTQGTHMTYSKDKTARINIRLSQEQKNDIAKRARQHDMTITEYILYVMHAVV